MQVRNDATAPPLVPGAAGGPKRLRRRDRQIIFENMTSACPVREAARPPRQSRSCPDQNAFQAEIDGCVCHRARDKSLRSHASAWHTIVSRSLKCGCHLRTERARSEAATTHAGSPNRRGAHSTLKSTPETRFVVSTTSSTHKARPYPQLR